MKLNRISQTFNSETRNKLPMRLQIFADGGEAGAGAEGGNGGEAGAGAEGGDGGEAGAGAEGTGGKQPTVEELMAQLAEERARSAKLQNEKNTASTEAANFKKQLRAKMTAEEAELQAKQEHEQERENRIKELENRLQIGEYTERCMSPEIGMAKDAARELAQAITEQDADKIFAAIGTHIKTLKTAWEQEFVASRKDFSAGHGDGKESLAMQKAKQLSAGSSKKPANADIIKHYM